jgi:hypothetical protein
VLGGHVGKGQAHPESRVAVSYLCLCLEDALIPENPQPDVGTLGERIERVDIAAPKTQFRGTPGKYCSGIQLRHLRGRDERAAPNRTPLSCLQGFVFLNHCSSSISIYQRRSIDSWPRVPPSNYPGVCRAPGWLSSAARTHFCKTALK